MNKLIDITICHLVNNALPYYLFMRNDYTGEFLAIWYFNSL